MIPVAFDYAAPSTIEEALAALASGGDEAKVLAGGQSLLPVMRLRMAAPTTVVDLNRIPELSGVTEDGDHLVIGAMTRHHDIATDPLIREHAALISLAAATVADPQVRHRGTFGGALVHADPAGDMLAPALAMDAEFVIAGADGKRTVPASEFFVDYFTSAVGEEEILLQVRVPKYTGWGAQYQKFARIAQAWSIVGVAATVKLDGGTIAGARVALTNMSSVPVRATGVEQALTGQPATLEAITAAAAHAAEGTQPPNDANGDAAYREHLATVLTTRAVATAAGVGS